MKAGHIKFCKSLTKDERILIAIRDELYNNSWERMLEDLEDRLRGRPYIFKLTSRIRDDIKRIKKLKSYEEKHNVNLADFLERSL
jgi:hypothetical protein